jgi:hypothetical protein
MAAKPFRLVYLEWEDAGSRAAWADRDEAESFGASDHVVRQSGFLLADTRRYLLLAGSWTPETDFATETYADLTRIPRTWIRRRVVLGTVTSTGVVHLRGASRARRRRTR